MLNLWLDAAAFPGNPGSDRLVKAFRAIHTPTNTETAFIHPDPRWLELASTVSGPYGSPVTMAPLFPGVYWTTFLGEHHLALFELDRLRDLEAYEVEWSGDRGLLLRVCRDIGDATAPMVEAEMLGLTEVFRSALKAPGPQRT